MCLLCQQLTINTDKLNKLLEFSVCRFEATTLQDFPDLILSKELFVDRVLVEVVFKSLPLLLCCFH